MEHSIDLAACHFIQDVSPSSAHFSAGGFDGSEGEGDGNEEFFNNFDIADSVGKALALVKQVSLPPLERRI